MHATFPLAAIARRRGVLVAAGFGIGLLLGYRAISGIDWSEVCGQIADTSPLAVAGTLVLVMLSAFLRSLRWRLLWLDARVSVMRLFWVENASLGLNNISPIRLLDEPAILTMLTLRDKHPASMVLATVVMSRVQDLMATVLFGAVALAGEPGLREHAGPAAYVSVLLAGVLVALFNLKRIGDKSALVARIPGIARYGEAVSTMWRRKPLLASTFGLTGAYWLVLGPAAYVLAHAMGLELTIFQAVIVVLGSVFFATSVPGLPGAIGTFELAVVEITGLWGVPHTQALGYALILHLALFLPAILIAFAVLPWEGFRRAGWGVRSPAELVEEDPTSHIPISGDRA